MEDCLSASIRIFVSLPVTETITPKLKVRSTLSNDKLSITYEITIMKHGDGFNIFTKETTENPNGNFIRETGVPIYVDSISLETIKLRTLGEIWNVEVNNK